MLARLVGAAAVLVARRGAAVRRKREVRWESMVCVCVRSSYGRVGERTWLEMGSV